MPNTTLQLGHPAHPPELHSFQPRHALFQQRFFHCTSTFCTSLRYDMHISPQTLTHPSTKNILHHSVFHVFHHGVPPNMLLFTFPCLPHHLRNLTGFTENAAAAVAQAAMMRRRPQNMPSSMPPNTYPKYRNYYIFISDGSCDIHSSTLVSTNKTKTYKLAEIEVGI